MTAWRVAASTSIFDGSSFIFGTCLRTFASPSVRPSRNGETTACVTKPTSSPPEKSFDPLAPSPPASSATLVNRSEVPSRSRSRPARPRRRCLSKETAHPRPHSNGETLGSYSTPPMMKPPSIRKRSSAVMPITAMPSGAPASITASHRSSARPSSTHSS